MCKGESIGNRIFAIGGIYKWKLAQKYQETVAYAKSCLAGVKKAVLRIRIRMDPELLPGSESGIIVPDPDPAKSERADK